MWEFLGYYEEEINKIKKGVKIFIVAFGFLFLVFTLLKTFYLNKPKNPPEEIAISYLKSAQTSNYTLGEKYLYPNFKKVKILEREYEFLKNFFQKEQTEKEGKEPEFKVEYKKIEKNKAFIKLLEKTNKKEGWFFFGYYLPSKLSFEISLEKIGNWKEGFKWKIIEINSSDLIKKVKFGEKVELEKGVLVKLIKLEEYQLENIEIPEEIKILTLEVEYENKTENDIEVDSFGNWRIIDKEGNAFYPPSISSAQVLKTPILMGLKIKKGEIKRGYTIFELPKEINVKEIIYRDWQRKIVFEYERK